MIKVRFGHTYTLPGDWSELDFNKYMELQRLEMPEKLKNLYNGEDVDDFNDSDNLDLLKYQISYLDALGLPRSMGEVMPIEDVGKIYEEVSKFHGLPEKPNMKKSFWLGGMRYTCDWSVIDKKYPGKNLSFAEFLHGTAYINAMGKMEQGDLEQLPYLLAILFRKNILGKVSKYEPDKLDKRAEKFKRMNMEQIWGAYFFLLTSKISSVKSSLTYLKEVAKTSTGGARPSTILQKLKYLIKRGWTAISQ